MKNTNIISYEKEPVEFERKLRKNLSSDNHTKETLINFAIQIAIEAEIREIELKKYRDLAVEKIQSEHLLNLFLNNAKTKDLNQIAIILEKDFGLIDFANLIRKLDAKVKSSRGKKIVQIKLANDPVQKAKKEIEVHYQSVKTQFKRHGYGARFIRDMHAKYPVIVDSDTIKRLVTRLKKSNEHIPVS